MYDITRSFSFNDCTNLDFIPCPYTHQNMSSSRILAPFSSLLKKQKCPWPEPGTSVGTFSGTKKTKKGEHKCWEAKGPAQEEFQKISTEIRELLNITCDPVPSSSFVVFDIFMIVKTFETAIPHIMFPCKRRKPRKSAVKAIQNSEIVSHCPLGIALGHWDYPPHIKAPQLLGSSIKTSRPDR
jgi:hypothetical protein